MLNNGKYIKYKFSFRRYRLMYEESEKKRYGERIENLKEKYNKYELGEMKADELKRIIKNVSKIYNIGF
jgi:hypothetical protein